MCPRIYIFAFVTTSLKTKGKKLRKRNERQNLKGKPADTMKGSCLMDREKAKENIPGSDIVIYCLTANQYDGKLCKN